MQAKLLTYYLCGYLLICFVWPALRVWRRYGVWPMVFNRRARSAQVLIGIFFKLMLVGLVVLSGLVGWWQPDMLTVIAMPIQISVLGWGLMGGGTAICIVSQRHMGASWRIGIDDRKTALVTNGLYRFTRNPIFLGVLLCVAGWGLLLPSWWSLTVFTLTWMGIRFQVTKEEAHLLEMHSVTYREYTHSVGRFIPKIGLSKATDGKA